MASSHGGDAICSRSHGGDASRNAGLVSLRELRLACYAGGRAAVASRGRAVTSMRLLGATDGAACLPLDAESAAGRAVEMGETLLRQHRGDDSALSELALARIVAGRTCAANGHHEPARAHWLRALEIIGTRQGSNDWRFLEPAALALAPLERHDEAQAVAVRLRRFGYHSLDPLAAATLDAATQRSAQTK